MFPEHALSQPELHRDNKTGYYFDECSTNELI